MRISLFVVTGVRRKVVILDDDDHWSLHTDLHELAANTQSFLMEEMLMKE